MQDLDVPGSGWMGYAGPRSGNGFGYGETAIASSALTKDNGQGCGVLPDAGAERSSEGKNGHGAGPKQGPTR